MSDLLMRGRVLRLLAAAVATTFKVSFDEIAGIGSNLLRAVTGPQECGASTPRVADRPHQEACRAEERVRLIGGKFVECAGFWARRGPD